MMLPKTKPILPLLPVNQPTVRVDPHGVIFNREAAELIGIDSSSRITIVQEEDKPINLFVQVTQTSGYPLMRKNKRLMLNSRSLSRRILANAGCASSTALFRLGEPTYNHIGTRIVPIITLIDYAERNKV